MDRSRRHKRSARRITPGTGRRLRPFRWWHQLSRALFYLPLETQQVYAVDVPYWQRIATEDGKGKAHLFLDDRHIATSTFPAAFPVEGGVIEVTPSAFGLRRCHYVPEHGPQRQLLPDTRSAEGRRARLEKEHPLRSRAIGVLSLLVLLTCTALAVPQLLEVLTGIPPVTEKFGQFTSPVAVPTWGNVALGLAAATASVERATRLRYSWLDAIAQE
ncbi:MULTISPECIES: hypothetical protein [unclassified Brachybacterium]|uniref:hypothetical protein n=1 Tax=unclassified Brachybacterium TaxID=2623841 RepID=UPI00361216FE